VDGAAAETTKATGMHAAKAATVEATAAATEAGATAMAEGHCAGCHPCCKRHGYRTCEKLIPHKSLHLCYAG
jgi:hypothetical protein